MRASVITFLFLFLSVFLLAQTPEAFNYQGVVRNLEGQPITNQMVGVEIAILQAPLQTEVYKETHEVMSNNLGLFSIAIGAGELVNGDFSTINWGEESFFLQIAIDENGGNNYRIIGSTQLLSVPYALHAKTAEKVLEAPETPWQETDKGILYEGRATLGTEEEDFIFPDFNIRRNTEVNADPTGLSVINSDPRGRTIGLFGEAQSQNYVYLGYYNSQNDSIKLSGEAFRPGSAALFTGAPNGLNLYSTRNKINFWTEGINKPIPSMSLSTGGYLGIANEEPQFFIDIKNDAESFSRPSPNQFISMHNTSNSRRSNVALRMGSGTGESEVLASVGVTANSYTVVPGLNGLAYMFNNYNGIALRAINPEGVIKFYTGGNEPEFERMRLDPLGNLGVGTSKPSAKLQISDGDIYIENINKGIIMKSPNGQCWRVTVGDDGQLIATAVTCPEE